MPSQLIERRARLQRRHRVDQIGDRFRLHQVDPAVQKRAQRELARLGEPRAGVDRGLHDRAQHDRAAVRAQLDDIVAGVGMRRGEDMSRRSGRRLSIARELLVGLRLSAEGS